MTSITTNVKHMARTTGSKHQGQSSISDPDQNLGFSGIFHKICTNEKNNHHPIIQNCCQVISSKGVKYCPPLPFHLMIDNVCSVSVACFGVRVSVMFHRMFHLLFVHYTFSSGWVADRVATFWEKATRSVGLLFSLSFVYL